MTSKKLLNYSDYLKLDSILNSQELKSKENNILAIAGSKKAPLVLELKEYNGSNSNFRNDDSYGLFRI